MRGVRGRGDTPGMTADAARTAIATPVDLLPDGRRTTGTVWAGHLSRVLSEEIRAAVGNGTITGAEGEQLLARLVLVLDQGTSTSRW